MDKLNKIIVIAETAVGAAELTNGAKELVNDDSVILVYCGAEEFAKGAEIAYITGELSNKSLISFFPAIIELIKEQQPDIVLAQTTKNGRLIAASIAANFYTNTMTDTMDIRIENGEAISKRMVYGGAAILTEKGIGNVAVACVPTGVFEPGNGQKPSIIYALDPVETGIKLIEKREKKVQTVDLSAAKNVVSVGRGFGDKQNLQLARDFALAIGAEVGCSRPVAEEEKWMPKEAYIGVSGKILKPDVYIGVGVSGQVQHMVGASQADTIIAINKDKGAPIFQHCDYGLVGDLNIILPALTKLFNNSH